MTDPGTRLSVIVCTYNREKYIRETLHHLLNQREVTEQDYEVIIVNNNSSDRTADICTDFIGSYQAGHFKYFNEPRQGHTFARNRGISESKGQYLAFLDDDAFTASHYARNIIEFFDSRPEIMALGGKIEPLYENIQPVWMSKYLWPLVAAIDLGDKAIPFPGNKFPIGANMAFRKEVFTKYGKFNTELGRRGTGLEGGDEKDMFYRIRKGGEKVFYVPRVYVQHVIPDTRLSKKYIRSMAIGVGTSEKKRLKNSPISLIVGRILDELKKIAGTLVLTLLYIALGKLSAAWMLIRFRIWVIKGFLTRIA